MQEKTYAVYIVRCADGTLYTGMSDDVLRRVETHNRGEGARYTRGRTPVVLAYREDGLTRSEALRREYAVKRLSHTEKEALIARFATIL